jgi:hypothetical protein
MSDKPKEDVKDKKPKKPKVFVQSATVKPAEGKCFVCKTTDKVMEVKFKDDSFSGKLCTEHMYEHLNPEIPF